MPPGYAQSSICQYIRRGHHRARPDRIDHSPEGKEKDRAPVLADQEIENVLHTIQNHEHGLFLAVLYYLGLRRGEALACNGATSILTKIWCISSATLTMLAPRLMTVR